MYIYIYKQKKSLEENSQKKKKQKEKMEKMENGKWKMKREERCTPLFQFCFFLFVMQRSRAITLSRRDRRGLSRHNENHTQTHIFSFLLTILSPMILWLPSTNLESNGESIPSSPSPTPVSGVSASTFYISYY